MPTDLEIQNRLDAGDFAGATRITIRKQIGEVKAQREAALVSAVERFYDEFPEFGTNWEFYTSLMRRWLKEHHIDPATANLSDLRSAWFGACRPPRIPAKTTPAPLAQPALAPEPPDAVEVEARRLISSREVTAEKIANMGSAAFERASHSRAFCRACELLEPAAPPAIPLTRGELALEFGKRELAQRNGIVLPDFDPAVEIARTNREMRSAFANYSEPAQQTDAAREADGPNFSRGRTTKPGRRVMTAAEAKENERRNAEREGPQIGRGDAVLEQQRRIAEHQRRLQKRRDAEPD
jgi:hypothetical protein